MPVASSVLTLNDLNDDASRFYMGKTAIILSIISASSSFLSSAFIILVVWKSRRNTSYHRIMVFMSGWEMLRSLCIALSTIPMPKDVMYPFYGPSFGTFQTCEAQAFLALFVGGMTISTSTFLNVYYLLTIRYFVKEETMKHYWEPIGLFTIISLSLVAPIILLRKEYLNPTPYETYCMVGSYPFFCDGNLIPCIRGKPFTTGIQDSFRDFVLGIGTLEMIVLTVSMVLIIHTFYKSDRDLTQRLKKEMKSDHDHDSEIAPYRTRKFMTKVIAQQALMYVSALLLTWIFLVISFFKTTVSIAVCKEIFVPLRGTMNMLIFVYHKLYALRRTDADLSHFQALMLLIGDTKNVPEDIVSNIEMISSHSLENNFKQMYSGLRLMKMHDGFSVSGKEEADSNNDILSNDDKINGESIANHFDDDVMTLDEHHLQSTNLGEWMTSSEEDFCDTSLNVEQDAPSPLSGSL